MKQLAFSLFILVSWGLGNQAFAQEAKSSAPGAASCGDWSAKFDQVDDPEMLRLLRAYRQQGWNSLVQQGIALGVNLNTQVLDGEQQLVNSREAAIRAENTLKQMGRAFPEATAKDCEGIADRGQPWMETACDLHKRKNEVLAVEGMLELLRCRGGDLDGRNPALPSGTHVIATFEVQVTPAKKPATGDTTDKCQSCLPGVLPMPKGKIVEVSPDQTAKPVVITEGDFLLLRFAKVGGTGFMLEPGRGVLQTPEALYNLPNNATGLIKALKAGTAKVSILGALSPGQAASTQAAGGNPNDDVSPNWSGYVVPGKDFSFISGHWEVPQLWGVGNRASGTWIGIDGTGGSQTLLQAGTVQESSSGFMGIGAGQDYWPFWELVPENAAQKIPFTVKPGDQISVMLRSFKGGQTVGGVPSVWEIVMSDNTQQWNFEQVVEYQGDLAHAVWIEEAPTSCVWVICNEDTLANYQSVTFDNNGILPGVSAPQPSFNIPPPSPLNTIPPPAFKVDFPGLMASESESMMQNSVIVSTPSNPDGDGDGFTLAFGPSMPSPPGPFVTTTTLSAGIVQTPFSATLQVLGATSPKWFSSQLPPGLSLDSAKGIISGTPQATGTTGIGVWVADTANPGTFSQLQHLDVMIVPPWAVLHCQFFPLMQKTICW